MLLYLSNTHKTPLVSNIIKPTIQISGRSSPDFHYRPNLNPRTTKRTKSNYTSETKKKKSKKIPLSVQNQVSRTKEKTSFLESTPYHSAALTSRIQKPIRRLREEYSALITGTGPACCM